MFNFYSPNFSPAGELGQTGKVAPEMQITTDSTIVGYANLVAYSLYGEQSIDTPANFPTIHLDLSDLDALAGDPVALVDRIDLLFTDCTNGRRDKDNDPQLRSSRSPTICPGGRSSRCISH